MEFINNKNICIIKIFLLYMYKIFVNLLINIAEQNVNTIVFEFLHI